MITAAINRNNNIEIPLKFMVDCFGKGKKAVIYDQSGTRHEQHIRTFAHCQIPTSSPLHFPTFSHFFFSLSQRLDYARSYNGGNDGWRRITGNFILGRLLRQL
jgi:hypothetical protein